MRRASLIGSRESKTDGGKKKCLGQRTTEGSMLYSCCIASARNSQRWWTVRRKNTTARRKQEVLRSAHDRRSTTEESPHANKMTCAATHYTPGLPDPHECQRNEKSAGLKSKIARRAETSMLMRETVRRLLQNGGRETVRRHRQVTILMPILLFRGCSFLFSHRMAMMHRTITTPRCQDPLP